MKFNFLDKKKLIILCSLLTLALVLGFSSLRWDLTADRRYTLHPGTIKTLKGIQNPIKIEVYLEGNFPAQFRQLRNETENILEEFHRINSKVDFVFIDPIAEKISQDTLMGMGMQPSMLPDMKDGKMSQIILFPYAAIKYKGYGSSVPLITQQVGIDARKQLDTSIENLEYNLISGLENITRENRKNIGFLVNQQEIGPQQFRSFIELALQKYNAGPILPQNGVEISLEDFPRLQKMDALVVAKPRKAFSEKEKIILDQYMMNGGKMLWMLDAVNAEMDSLYRTDKILAFPQDLNLTDFFFNYGLRLQPGLVKDLKKAAMLRLQTGEIAGNAQYENFPWPYFPMASGDGKHPITKNINPIRLEFPTSIEILPRPHLKQTILYQSSDRTKVKTVPNFISLNEITNIDSLNVMESPTRPKAFAVLVEGKFKSAYTFRSERSQVFDFLPQAKKEGKMILVSDGDIAKNQVIKGNPLPLGVDILTDQQYGNGQFISNALDYLLDDTGLMELRSRNLDFRPLDRQRLLVDRRYWQSFNLIFPILLSIGAGGLFWWIRKRRYSLSKKN